MRQVLVLVLALVACSERKREAGYLCERDFDCESYVCYASICQSGALGGKCFEDYQCRGGGISCYRGECRTVSAKGGMCDDTPDCTAGLTCAESQCRDDEGVKQLARKNAADKEARLLAASGVADRPAAEVSVNPAGAGARVRTVQVAAKHSVFAACKTDERLVGGGCNSDKEPVYGSFPSATGPDDTVGARWNCRGDVDQEITAYALCQKLP